MLKKKKQMRCGAACFLSLIFMVGMLSACGQTGAASSKKSPGSQQTAALSQAVTFTDAIGNQVKITSAKRVVALMGSFAEVWADAGGTLVGTTKDAFSGHGLHLDDTVANLGSYLNPNMEQIISLKPDFVILSADTAQQVKLCASLRQAGLNAACFHVLKFEDYLDMLHICTQLTGREDLYEKNGLAIQKQIDNAIAGTKGKKGPSVLFLRAYSTKYDVMNSSTMTGMMMKDLGAENIADRNNSILKSLSMDAIVESDPDYILVVVMGADEEKALSLIDRQFKSNPAWAGLKAVKNQHYAVIPRELFHYKPNARWGESYEYLAKLFYGD
ncbi:MAG: ABC transporter substrate-binding protein [Oscillospiraceae bacterium]|jgi:iron complex transport system substrate-binding protein|nr:ABC transporter substrate-binding protein [Oscillospiraceae bacterium]